MTRWPELSGPPPTSHLRRVLAFLLVLGVVCYGGAVTLGISRIPFNLIETTMAISTSLDGRLLTLNGTTSLPDGAVIACETWHESEDDGLGSLEYDSAEQVVVVSGTFLCHADLKGWPTGMIRATSTFYPWDQAADVVDRYGYRGERLSGPAVFHDSDGWVLDVRENVPLAG